MALPAFTAESSLSQRFGYRRSDEDGKPVACLYPAANGNCSPGHTLQYNVLARSNAEAVSKAKGQCRGDCDCSSIFINSNDCFVVQEFPTGLKDWFCQCGCFG